VVSDRFGLGDRLTAANIDKWMLYQVAQYCDQLVPDGKGGDGMEPRYTCNVYVQDRNDAYTVMRDFAAIFRGMTYWGGNQIVALADMPRDVDYSYTNANTLDGKFTYSSTSKPAIPLRWFHTPTRRMLFRRNGTCLRAGSGASLWL
jgi:predicted phage tail protein